MATDGSLVQHKMTAHGHHFKPQKGKASLAAPAWRHRRPDGPAGSDGTAAGAQAEGPQSGCTTISLNRLPWLFEEENLSLSAFLVACIAVLVTAAAACWVLGGRIPLTGAAGPWGGPASTPRAVDHIIPAGTVMSRAAAGGHGSRAVSMPQCSCRGPCRVGFSGRGGTVPHPPKQLGASQADPHL